MKRRAFSAHLVGSGLGLASLADLARAQGSPVEGKDYVRLSQPARVSAPAGKVEVIEFFWYGCPHCNAFEPMLDGWSRKLPADVAFHRVPVGFTALHLTHAKLFYAIEATGRLDALHRKVFAAIHVQGQRMKDEAETVAFMNANGVDGAKFAELFKSFSVQTKAQQAKQLSEDYKIDGVPALGVHGRYYTGGSLAGSNERALAVVDYLIHRTRSGA
jgi:thiol:disulfide interchange protein DsbA